MPHDPRENPSAGERAAFVEHVLGTAGHIDHGKSTIIERLTGVHPDRLREERERGLTIDLGYAPYRLRDGRVLGIIDVPGHERFIRNMVAGASGVDLVLLVVAADDGVMPQTREHLEILRMLGVRRGIVAITKIDLVDPEMRVLVEEDVRDLLAGSPLEGAVILPVSAVTGEGIEALREAIEGIVDTLPARTARGAFRMPVQRAFAVKGFGSVATGVPVSGRIRVGDTVEILPAGARARVRGLQAYEAAVEEGRCGHRLAVNLSEIDYKRLRRGHVLAEPGSFRPSSRLEARLDWLASNARPLRRDLDVRVHLGTSEVVGRLRRLHPASLEPGASGTVALLLHEPVVAVPGDPYVLRLQSPLVTLGGGVILGTCRGKIRRGAPVGARLGEIESSLGDPRRLVSVWMSQAGREPLAAEDLRRDLGLGAGEIGQVLAACVAEGEVVSLGESGPYLHARSFAAARDQITKAVERHFERHALHASVDRLRLLEGTRVSEVVLDAVLASLVAKGTLRALGRGRYAPPEREVVLSAAQQTLRASLERVLAEGGLQPPSLEEWIQVHAASNPAEGRELARLLVEEGVLVRVAEGIFLHRDALARAREAVAANIRRHGDLRIPELRDALRTSRKYLIPLLEYLDATGFTARRGARRVLRGGEERVGDAGQGSGTGRQAPRDGRPAR